MQGKLDSFFSFKYIARLFYTLRYLKWQQFFFRVYYPIKYIFFSPKEIGDQQLECTRSHQKITFPSFLINQQLFDAQDQSFTFLNQRKYFAGPIEWSFDKFGLLWKFHLHYLDWLNDANLSVDDRLVTLQSFVASYKKNYIFCHSYPASLRIVNVIKFLIEHEIKDDAIVQNLYRQASRLSAFPEYEIRANHLLQNGIALFWAGIYFGDPNFELIGKKILKKELKVQVLNDGIHFEKSAAYQSIITKDLLGLIFLLRAKSIDNQFDHYLTQHCTLLLSGLRKLLTPDGRYMNFGDANDEMSIPFLELLIVAQNLHININELELDESGYRFFGTVHFNLLFNLGNVPAVFQPGHAHADAFSFCLNSKKKQIIVDRGVSTYEPSLLRLEEKSTAAHNTISIENANTADVWSAFRMGKRAEIKLNTISERNLECEHNAFQKCFGIIHSRKLEIQEDLICIIDDLRGWNGQMAQLFLHFHPDVELVQVGECWKVKDTEISIKIENCNSFVDEYQYSIGFNKTRKAKRIIGDIQTTNIKTVIKFFDEKTY